MDVENEPVVFETDGGAYRYIVMPMALPKTDKTKPAAETQTAEPDADTGAEVVGTVSTEKEESMDNVDEAPRSDNELETKVFQFLQENDQLQAKVEHYKALLDRAMRVIEKLKAEQCVCA
jgi:hypothetical protein